MKKIMKLAAAAAVSALLAFGCLGMTGCGPSDEEVLQDGLTQAFDQLKGLNSDNLATVLSEDGSSLEEIDKAVSQLGVTGEEFVLSMMDGFDYEIQSIEVDGKVAHVTVECTVKDFSDISKNMQSKVEAWAKKNAGAGLNQAKIDKAIAKLVMETMDECKLHQKTVDFDVNKDGNTWMLDQATGYFIGKSLFS